jgi:hypothetical protein
MDMLLYVATKNLLYHIRLIVISSPHKLLLHQTMPSPFSLDHGGLDDGASGVSLSLCKKPVRDFSSKSKLP